MFKRIMGVASTMGILSYLYAKKVEQRSYRSFLIELGIRLVDTKRKYASDALCEEQISREKDKTRRPYPGTRYAFRCNMTTQHIGDTTVYHINQRHDKSQRVIMYMHGGAWYQDPLTWHFEYIELLAERLDAHVIMPVYPKIPHADYRATFDMLTTLYAQVIETVADAQRVSLIGDSAGGQIVLSFAQHVNVLGWAQPGHIVMLSPVLDATYDNVAIPQYESVDPMIGVPGAHYFSKLWAGDTPLEDYKVSPIYGEFEGLGHMTFVIGTKEILYPDVVRLSERLHQLDIAHDLIVGQHLYHVYPLMPIPERETVLTQIVTILSGEGA